jgi:hypothetical protein
MTRKRAEERLKATAHDIKALRDSSHATRPLVDSQRGCRDRERLAHFKLEPDSKKTELEDREEELRDVMMVKSGCAANRS